MTNRFHFIIKRFMVPNLEFSLDPGEVVYILGANGSGKSALVASLFSTYRDCAKKISAHRQTWFHSSVSDLTPANRERLERDIRSEDGQVHARYILQYANERAAVAMYDLIDSENTLARKIAELVRAGEIPSAEEAAKTPAPIKVINELMRLSNIPVEIGLGEHQKIIARKNGSRSYSVAELSDGERNAFLIAADVLTARSCGRIVVS